MAEPTEADNKTALEIAQRFIGSGYEIAGRVQRCSQAIAQALADEREEAATIALEQRCERNTPWDMACIAIAQAIRGGK